MCPGSAFSPFIAHFDSSISLLAALFIVVGAYLSPFSLKNSCGHILSFLGFAMPLSLLLYCLKEFRRFYTLVNVGFVQGGHAVRFSPC